jgi:hypothetical protein
MSGVGTMMTYRGLVRADEYCEAVLSDLPSGLLDDPLRALEVTRLSVWVQRHPDAAIVRWEGKHIDSVLERFGASDDPMLVRWRGMLRAFSGSAEMDSYWDASRHRIFSWAKIEARHESEIKVFRCTSEVEALLSLYRDVQSDPAHFRIFERIRGGQGVTRVEAWTQQRGEETLFLNLIEARDLESAHAAMEAETNEFDRRLMKTRRAALKGPPLSGGVVAKLLIDWQAG